MIGQAKLLQRLNRYTIDSLPRTLLFEGEKGCGKHLFANYISVKLTTPIIDMTNDINNEFIENTYTNVFTTIYLIDSSVITEKQQNTLLKFLEEPPMTARIILLTEDKNFLLPTIVNRCLCLKFDNYSTDELKIFAQSTFGHIDENKLQIMLNVARTPGKLISLNSSNLEDTFKLCDMIPDKINLASLPNTLSIANRLNYKDDYSKVDVDVFLKLLNNRILEKYKVNKQDKYIKMYNIIQDSIVKLRKDLRLNKQDLIENLLCKLWEID